MTAGRIWRQGTEEDGLEQGYECQSALIANYDNTPFLTLVPQLEIFCAMYRTI